MTLQPWTLLEESLEFSAPPWVSVYREKVQLSNGTVVDDFYRVKLIPSVLIVALTRDGDLVMVRGYRHGAGTIMLSAPAGMIDAGETPLEAAKRELLEETGYESSSWETLAQFVSDATKECATVHMFLARNVVKRTEPVRDPLEELEVELVKRSDFLEKVFSGELGSMATVAAVHLADGKQSNS